MILLTHTPPVRDLYYGSGPLKALQELGAVRINRGGALAGEKLVRAAAGCSVIVADRAVPAPAGLFGASPKLVAFVRNAVDIRTVDIPAASAAGVLVTRASPGFIPAVAELIIGQMVDLCRNVSTAVCQFRAGRQPPVRMGHQIAGSTVGVIGFGGIGRRLAKLLAAMDAEILVHDPYTDDEGFVSVELAELLGRADIVVCLAAATPETAGLMGRDAFARMRPGALFINDSRGELVDEAALAEALESGHLAGAALDVGMAPDQMPSFDLATRPDVVATPHVGGLTQEAAEHQAFETVRQVAAILAGHAPEGSVNADAATRLNRAATGAATGAEAV